MSEVDRISQHSEQDVARAWALLLQEPAGRMVVEDILKLCGIYQPSFVPGAADSTAFAEGRRSIGLAILERRVLPSGHETYAKMMTERDERIERISEAIEKEQETFNDG